MTPVRAVPDLDALLGAVFAQSAPGARDLTHHGERHWRRVARNGAELIEAGAGGDPAVVFAFALVHDSQRERDDEDPDHGPRATNSLPGFADHLHLDVAEFEALGVACWLHSGPLVSDHPTVGTCWDSDRLDLWRVLIRPDPWFLSTEQARDPARITACCRRSDEDGPSWEELFERYAALG